MSREQARQHAHAEYTKFAAARKIERYAKADQRISELAREAKKLRQRK